MKTSVMDRREIVRAFQERLGEVISRSGCTRSAFAGRVGIDRSTLSQLLDAENVRLPRAETVAAIAVEGRVSVDWLLGLSQEGQLGTDVFSEALEVESAASSPTDERLARWHAEAAGYKIRYVPTTLPDLLKSEEVIRYEYRAYSPLLPEGRIEQAEARLAYSRRPETDMEICSSVQSVEEFIRGEGMWRGLPQATRWAQVDLMRERLDELYPTVRWFLFDGLRRYSVPLTIFGPQRAAVYIGDMYFVFNATEHIRVLTGHFDYLIRAALVQPPDVIACLERLCREVGKGRDS